VGREIIKTTYESFFRHVKFNGKFDIHVTIDPAYGVSEEEIEIVVNYLESIKSYACVNSVEVTRFYKNIGLEGSLMILLSQCHNRYGINLEDDWEFFKDIDLNILIVDMRRQKSCMIAFGSTHLANRGTYEKVSGVEFIENSNAKLQRLVPPNWACDYIPLAPNIHDNHIWITAYITGLMFDQNKERCPEERTREYIRSHGLREKYNVLWTQEIVVKDIGRQWLAEHNQSKCIFPEEKIDTEIYESASNFTFKGYTRSEALYNRAVGVIPGQTNTFMKRGAAFLGRQPLYADKGYGCYFLDVDGNRYIDYVAGLGVLQLGHCNTAFTEAVRTHLNKGVYFSLPTWHEIEAAEALRSVIPNADMVRLLKSGGDVCSAAVTLSRFITGRPDILSYGYHGWHEQFQPYQPGANQLLKQSIVEFDIYKNNVNEIITKSPNRFACVIISLPYKKIVEREVLLSIREACNTHGVLLIFDEIVTGFRLALGGAQEHYSIDADICLFSKALTGGAELAAISGKKAYMKSFENLYVSTTMAGEMTALQCMINAINIYKTTDIISRTQSLGNLMKLAVNSISLTKIGKQIFYGYDNIPYLDFEDETQNETCSEYLMRNGIYMRKGSNFITGAHGRKDIEYTIKVFDDMFGDRIIK
jgi:glutamate-1-semialdehyde aminotransferase